MVVWKEQPIDYSERSLALETLLDVRNQGGFDLNGILYWKLSTDASHEAIEPFVLHIGADSQDPLQQVLVDFTRP